MMSNGEESQKVRKSEGPRPRRDWALIGCVRVRVDSSWAGGSMDDFDCEEAKTSTSTDGKINPLQRRLVGFVGFVVPCQDHSAWPVPTSGRSLLARPSLGRLENQNYLSHAPRDRHWHEKQSTPRKQKANNETSRPRSVITVSDVLLSTFYFVW